MASAEADAGLDDVAGFKLPAIRKAKPYFFFLATLRVFLAVFFTADFAFLAFAFFAFFAMLPSVNEMAVSLSCTRESKCTAFGLHQRGKKNSVPLKEVLTQRARCDSRGDSENTAAHCRHKSGARWMRSSLNGENQKAADRQTFFITLEKRRSCAGSMMLAPLALKNAPSGL